MRRLLFLIILSFVFLLVPKNVYADYGLEYKNFDSQIVVNQDTSITVKETIKVNYETAHHGIVRNIPGKIKIISVTDENGALYTYSVSGTDVKKIKIGDPDKTVTGFHEYIIIYNVWDQIREFSDHYELYWNVTGSDWDGDLPDPTASVISNFARIIRIKCFSGPVGEANEDCKGSFGDNNATFNSLRDTGVGSDFTIVIGFDKNNHFIFPSTLERIVNFLVENWIYLFTPMPFLVPLLFWIKKGRDQRYVSEDIYYEPEDKATKTVSIFERKFIPLVYSPIKSLTPAQAGTLIDQEVDIDDVVAEITELARLNYLKIRRIPKKGILGKDDYEFTNLNGDLGKLTNYQKEIMDGIFGSSDKVLMSSLKNKFYVNLKDVKNELYENMREEDFFDGNPEKVRQRWYAIVIVLVVLLILAMRGDVIAIFLVCVFGVLGFLVATVMPRRTAKGYALYRQIEGLKWYINKGLWRQEVAEKNLFIDEILPLAISLGVVTKLASDMKDLGLEPPTYVSNIGTGNFAAGFSEFQSGLGSSLLSRPGGSGSSGFGGGGFSGGGGGGGGGGGW